MSNLSCILTLVKFIPLFTKHKKNDITSITKHFLQKRAFNKEGEDRSKQLFELFLNKLNKEDLIAKKDTNAK
jgi:hypothetical protein